MSPAANVTRDNSCPASCAQPGYLTRVRRAAGVLCGSLQGGQRSLNALALVAGDQAGKHLSEVRMLSARMDILPAVGIEEGRFDRLRFARIDHAAAPGGEVAGIGLGLGLQEA